MENRIKILYVDDEEINLMLFKYNFSDKYEIITSDCGSGGLECLKKHPEIKVVISDMKMPNMTGLDFIAKAKEQYSDIRYYILTGFDINDEIISALKNKLILKYFRKPLNIKEIQEAIDEVI